MKTEKKIAVVNRFTKMVKFYNTDGSRDEEHPTGFYNSKDLGFYKESFTLKFIN